VASAFRGAVFDVDGVLVDSPHERAWRETLQELMDTQWRDLRPRTRYAPGGLTGQVYQELVAGKPRMSGARAIMEHFGVPDAAAMAEVYAGLKQRRVIDLARNGEFHAFADALRFVLAVRSAGIRVAAASSSKNAGLFLGAIRLDTFAAENALDYGFLRPGQTLLDFLDADTSGRDFSRGKPDPEIFLTAAEELELPPQMCFVVEDAVSGVAAARAGGMAALAVARADDEDLLAAAAADLVVTSLDDVDVSALAEGRLRSRPAGLRP
jgi:beta-phosphoglucomutase-like phosphatase (HAD superfamily)